MFKSGSRRKPWCLACLPLLMTWTGCAGERMGVEFALCDPKPHLLGKDDVESTSGNDDNTAKPTGGAKGGPIVAEPETGAVVGAKPLPEADEDNLARESQRDRGERCLLEPTKSREVDVVKIEIMGDVAAACRMGRRAEKISDNRSKKKTITNWRYAARRYRRIANLQARALFIFQQARRTFLGATGQDLSRIECGGKIEIIEREIAAHDTSG